MRRWWRPSRVRSSSTRRINHHKHGRGKLPAHLPRIEIVHDLTDEQKKCPCCGEQRVVHRQRDQRATGVRSRLAESSQAHPPQVRLQTLRRRMRQRAIASLISRSPPRPPQPIEKGLPGPGLLAYVITRSWATICRCTGWRKSSPAMAWTSPAARCAPGCWRPVSWSSRWWN